MLSKTSDTVYINHDVSNNEIICYDRRDLFIINTNNDFH